MMKKMLVLVCALFLGTAAYAAPAKTPIAHLSGTIEKYNTGTKQLTVKHGDKATTFEVSDKADVMKGKAKADASALTASSGQSVKVDYMMNGATKVAEKVEVAADHAMTPAKIKTKK